ELSTNGQNTSPLVGLARTRTPTKNRFVFFLMHEQAVGGHSSEKDIQVIGCQSGLRCRRGVEVGELDAQLRQQLGARSRPVEEEQSSRSSVLEANHEVPKARHDRSAASLRASENAGAWALAGRGCKSRRERAEVKHSVGGETEQELGQNGVASSSFLSLARAK